MPETDVELERKPARNIREYIKYELKKEKDMFVWVWMELTNQEGKRLSKKLFWVVLFGYIFSVIKPWTLSLVFTGLAAGLMRWHLVVWGLSLCTAVMVIGQFIHRKGLIYRELLFGESSRQLDQRTTELFFEKSLGTHIEKNNLLCEDNIRKGYDNALRLRALMIWEGTETIFGLVLPFIALWFLHWPSAALLTLVFVVHLVWSLFMNQKVMREGLPIDRKFRAMNRFRVERLDQIERVKNNNKEKEELIELGKKFEEVIQPDRKLWLWHADQSIWRGAMAYLALMAIMVYGAYMVWQGQMSIGLLYPLFAWSTQLADNFWRVGNLEREINFLTPSVLSMKEALTMPCGLELAKELKELKGEITRVEFKNVSCVYGTLPILKDISFVINHGEKVAIVGPSGAGKTTLAKLVLRYSDPTSGSILVNDVDLRELNPASFLPKVGYMPQDSQIFDGTIRYNLAYALSGERKANISNEEFWKLMWLLQIDFKDRLTHGLDTLVGRNGIRLSGGEGQRLMLGAAVIKKPSLMIIDEATSSLDATTEKFVQMGLEKVLSKEMSALIITHRLNTVRRICNKFIMISGNGGGSRVVAVADSFELLAKKSEEFRELALDQGIVL